MAFVFQKFRPIKDQSQRSKSRDFNRQIQLTEQAISIGNCESDSIAAECKRVDR